MLNKNKIKVILFFNQNTLTGLTNNSNWKKFTNIPLKKLNYLNRHSNNHLYKKFSYSRRSNYNRSIGFNTNNNIKQSKFLNNQDKIFKSKFINNKFRFKFRLKWGRKWFRCKKPYWRRKSYKYIKFYFFFIKGFYKNSVRRKSFFSKKVVRRLGYQSWHDYYRRKKIKFWFKHKILLRAAWMDRYQHWSHRKLFLTVCKYKKKYAPLQVFLKAHEFSLDRYILIWNILPKNITSINLFFIRYLIYSGFIWVNFKRMTSYRYQVKEGDCVFFLLSKQVNFLYSSKVFNQFQSKYRRGYKLKNFLRVYKKKKNKFTNRLNKFSIFFKKFRLLSYLFKHKVKYFKHYYYFFESSNTYKIFISLEPITWFILSFSLTLLPIFNSHFKITDLLINRRYYG